MTNNLTTINHGNKGLSWIETGPRLAYHGLALNFRIVVIFSISNFFIRFCSFYLSKSSTLIPNFWRAIMLVPLLKYNHPKLATFVVASKSNHVPQWEGWWILTGPQVVHQWCHHASSSSPAPHPDTLELLHREFCGAKNTRAQGNRVRRGVMDPDQACLRACLGH